LHVLLLSTLQAAAAAAAVTNPGQLFLAGWMFL
jgi:hypothetical protein